jgi:hypothetical protein
LDSEPLAGFQVLPPGLSTLFPIRIPATISSNFLSNFSSSRIYTYLNFSHIIVPHIFHQDEAKDIQRLELPPTADMHAHLRQAELMELTVPQIRKGGADTVFVMV